MDDQAKKEQERLKGKPVWYLKGPFYKYREDVKELAMKNGLRIIDARFVSEKEIAKEGAKETPKVTLHEKYQPKKAEEKK